jgi:PPP family 3-phenylpropionic acid transporter
VNIQILTLRGLNFSYYATQAVLLPFLPLYFIAKGLSTVEVGLLMTIGPFVAIFAQPVWGYISDRLKTVKKVVFLLWVMTIISSIGLFQAESFIEFFMYSLLIYFFMIPSVPLLDSISIKSTERLSMSYGSVRLWGSVGFTTIAVLSGFVIGFIGGIENIHFIYWSLWVLPMVLLFFLEDEPSVGISITLESVYSVFKNKQFIWFLLMAFIISVPHRLNDSLFGVYLSELGATEQMVGWAWALAAASEIPTFALLSRFMHRFHELGLLCLVSLIYMLRWLIYGMIIDPWILLFLQATHAVTFAVFWIVSIHYVVRLVPAELRSTGQSIFSAVFLGLAGITGGLVGGALHDQWGGDSMYYFGAIFALVAGVLFLFTHMYQRKRRSL